MQKLKHTSTYLSLIIAGVLGVALLLFNLPSSGWKALSVATGSMRPSILPGSLVFVHRVPTSKLQVGDVITYTNPKLSKEPITHRIVETGRVSGDVPTFVTKGDANPSPDPQIVGGQVVGQVIGSVPWVGGAIMWLRHPLQLGLIVGLPALIIIISEFQLMMRRIQEYGAEEARAHLQRSQPAANPAPLSPAVRKPPRRRSRIVQLAVAGLVLSGVGATAHTTSALLNSNTVSLSPNQLAVAAKSNHLLINQIHLGAGTVCGQPSQTISISNTGPGSTAIIHISSSCTITTTNSNSVSVTNSSNQTDTSGNASSSGNTSGGTATSGSTSNSSDSSTTITINNGSSPGGSAATIVQLYNPTASAISLAGWKLQSANGSQSFGSLSVPAHGSLAVAYTAEALQRLGGRLLLAGPTATVDTVSWGSDTSQLNPAAPAIGPSLELERKALGFDTDSAADWQTQ